MPGSKLLDSKQLEEAVLGKLIRIPARIGDDFPVDEWVKFEAFIKVEADGTVVATRQQATRTLNVRGNRVDRA